MFGRFGLKNHTNSIEWYHLQWPQMTSDPDFKITTFFDIEYLRNNTRWNHTYYTTSIGSRMRMVTFPMTLSDPNPGLKVTIILEC